MAARQDKVAIVTCVTSSWLAPACVTLLSVSRNLGEAKARLIIVVDKIDPAGREAVAEFAAKHGLIIELLTFQTQHFATLDTHRYSPATLLRLCLSEIMPKDLDRLLYLDSDILALEPLAPLLNMNLQGMALGAVPEVKLTSGRGVLTDRHRRRLGIPDLVEYFNAGVLLFDWQQVLAKGLLEQAIAQLQSGRDFEFLDQDVLNLVFAGNWHCMPLKWNVEQSSATYLGIKPALRHYNHALKPWSWPSLLNYRSAYQYYVDSLSGTSLSSFLNQPKRGNPVFGTVEYLFRRASLHQTRFLKRKLAKLL